MKEEREQDIAYLNKIEHRLEPLRLPPQLKEIMEGMINIVIDNAWEDIS